MSPGLLLFNPMAGGGRSRAELAGRVAEIFAAAGETLVPRATAGPGDASDVVEELMRGSGPEPADVFVLGGDGTLNEALTGAFRAGRLAEDGPGPRFGVVPAGTANVIARDLGLPRNPLRAAERLAGGGERPFDVGTCESSAGLRPFLLATGIGVEAEAIAAVDPRAKRLFGPAAFLRAGFRVAGRRDRRLRVSALLAGGERRVFEVPGSVTCGNSRLYGGPCRLSRLAAFDDGVLELVLMSSTSLPALLRLGLASRFADAAAAPGVQVLSATEVEVEAPVPVAIHVDAEPFGETPARIGVLRRAVRLRVPA